MAGSHAAVEPIQVVFHPHHKVVGWGTEEMVSLWDIVWKTSRVVPREFKSGSRPFVRDEGLFIVCLQTRRTNGGNPCLQVPAPFP